MIPAINQTKEIDKIIRNMILSQCNVDGSMVRNAHSEYGADLDKPDSDSVFNTIDTTDTLILFSTERRAGSNMISETRDDSKIYIYSALGTHVKIYGNDARDLATDLVARFRSQKVISTLWESGIHVEMISEPTETYEFLHGKMWLRNDFDIDIACLKVVSQTSEYDYYQSINKITTTEV